MLEAHEILKMYFERKRMNNSKYSLRALARDMDLSPSYISQVMTGKKKISENSIKGFIKVLELDDIAVVQLSRTLNPLQEPTESAVTKEDISFLNKFSPLEEKKYNILSDWYNIAILDLTTLKNFKSDPRWISEHLGISVLEAEIALERLLESKLLEEKNGIYVKTNNKMRLPTTRSKEIIRKFHQQMIKKAYDELYQKVDEEDFKKRLITGATFAINQKKIKEIQKLVHEKLYEITGLATSDDCDELYQLNIQFFPLSK